MGKFRKIRGHHWKEGLKISKIVKFESDLLKTNEDVASQSREILQTFVWWGAQTCPKQNKNICLHCEKKHECSVVFTLARVAGAWK